MHIAYARTPLPKSIFLAGPTPRSEDVPSWRPEALRLLEKHKFNGTVYVPEDSQASWAFNYDNQIEWELEALHSATVILFWIPREACMPGFTTNVEFGHFITQRNVVVGWPPTATKTKYLEGLARLHNTPLYISLEELVPAAIEMAERPYPTTAVTYIFRSDSRAPALLALRNPDPVE